MAARLLLHAVLAAALVAPSGAAHARQCGEAGAVRAALERDFAERPVFDGLSGQAAVELWVAEGGSWTFLIVSAAGVACILAAGNAGQADAPLRPRPRRPSGEPG
jgi:hypothetical protein